MRIASDSSEFIVEYPNLISNTLHVRFVVTSKSEHIRDFEAHPHFAHVGGIHRERKPPQTDVRGKAGSNERWDNRDIVDNIINLDTLFNIRGTSIYGYILLIRHPSRNITGN